MAESGCSKTEIAVQFGLEQSNLLDRRLSKLGKRIVKRGMLEDIPRI